MVKYVWHGDVSATELVNKEKTGVEIGHSYTVIAPTFEKALREVRMLAAGDYDTKTLPNEDGKVDTFRYINLQVIRISRSDVIDSRR